MAAANAVDALAAQVVNLTAQAAEHTAWQNAHEDRHTALENQVLACRDALNALQAPLQALEAQVLNVASEGSNAAVTLVSRVVSLEQAVMLEGTGLRARIAGIEQNLASATPVPVQALPAPPGIADPLLARIVAVENSVQTSLEQVMQHVLKEHATTADKLRAAHEALEAQRSHIDSALHHFKTSASAGGTSGRLGSSRPLGESKQFAGLGQLGNKGVSYAQWTELLEAKVGELRPTFGMECLEWARKLGATKVTPEALLEQDFCTSEDELVAFST